jgi:hypothetical protein
VSLPALDHGQSSAHSTSPAFTGFCSTYRIAEKISFSDRIHQSKYSLCQKAVPAFPITPLARFAVAAFDHRMIPGSLRFGFKTT